LGCSPVRGLLQQQILAFGRVQLHEPLLLGWVAAHGAGLPLEPGNAGWAAWSRVGRRRRAGPLAARGMLRLAPAR